MASGLIATVFGAALYLGSGAAQAQVVTTFAQACAGKSAGDTGTIGPFYTGAIAQGASIWTWTAADTTNPSAPTDLTAGLIATYSSALTVGKGAGVWVDIPAGQPPGANWIAVVPDTGAAGPAVQFTYTLGQTINVDSSVIDPATISVTGSYLADDVVNSFQVNGNSLLSTVAYTDTTQYTGALRSIATTAPTLGSLFQTGNNTLSFVVANFNDLAEGLYANVSISATCGGSATTPTVSITKTTTNTTALNPSDAVAYQLIVTNTSATVDATNVTVTDTVPDGIVPTSFAWGCTASAGATCPTPTSGTGNLSQLIASLPAGESLTYDITATATANAADLPSIVTNTATATSTDPLACDDGAALPCKAEVSIPPTSADMQGSTSTIVQPTVGTQVTETLFCTNAGPDTAVNATCDVSGAPTGADIQCTPAPVPPATGVTLAKDARITCTVTFTPANTASVTLTATAGSDTPDPNHANDKADMVITAATPLIASTSSTAVPTLSEIALLLLAALLGVSAFILNRRGR
jgi:uncharacterized repeat protein (TIGR01451 family)